MERGFEIRRITRRTKASDIPGWSIGGGFQIRVPVLTQLRCSPASVQKSAMTFSQEYHHFGLNYWKNWRTNIDGSAPSPSRGTFHGGVST
jgi:hypothetical protein